MAEPFIGEIRMVGFNFAQRGWALCEGQLLAIAQFQALFAILGTTYGGDGRTTFGLPDLRGRIPAHVGETLQLGQRLGVETVTLNTAQIPAHTHALPAASGAAELEGPSANVPARTGEPRYVAPTGGTATPLPAEAVGNTGGGQPHDNMSPVTVVNFAIALQGLFPPRA